MSLSLVGFADGGATTAWYVDLTPAVTPALEFAGMVLLGKRVVVQALAQPTTAIHPNTMRHRATMHSIKSQLHSSVQPPSAEADRPLCRGGVSTWREECGGLSCEPMSIGLSRGRRISWAQRLKALLCCSFVGCAGHGSNGTPAAAHPSTLAPTGLAPAPRTAAVDTCAQYVEALCLSMGGQSKACRDAKASTASGSTTDCAQAMQDVPRAVIALKAQRKDCNTLMDRVCSDIGEGTETCQMVRSQTVNFPGERCTRLLERYVEVIADLRRIEQRTRPLTAEWHEKLTAPDAPALGPRTAPVTLIEFSDFECEFCAKTASVLSSLRAKYGDRLRVVFRQFPLETHKHARAAAIAALAAHEQGKFWQYSELLYGDPVAMDDDALTAHAKQLRLNMPKFKAALKDVRLAERVDADIAMGKAIGIAGTPTVYVNGRKVSNATSTEIMSEAIDKVLNTVEPSKAGVL